MPLSDMVWVLVAAVGARGLAMTLNRIIDRNIDAENPRTAQRHLASGTMSMSTAWTLAVTFLGMLLLGAGMLNEVALAMSWLPVMAFVIYPLLITLFIKNMTWNKFLSGMRDAQITAFSTSSSVATLPVTMKCVEEKLGVSERTTSFVLPIGATVNMDGTSLYQAIAVVGLAQFHMVDLSFSQQAIIVLTATLASIGAAAIPSAGLVLMIIVLESVGLNPAWIALIFPIDRILDMCRTVVNVTGDSTVSTLVAASEGELSEVYEG